MCSWILLVIHAKKYIFSSFFRQYLLSPRSAPPPHYGGLRSIRSTVHSNRSSQKNAGLGLGWVSSGIMKSPVGRWYAVRTDHWAMSVGVRFDRNTATFEFSVDSTAGSVTSVTAACRSIKGPRAVIDRFIHSRIEAFQLQVHYSLPYLGTIYLCAKPNGGFGPE